VLAPVYQGLVNANVTACLVRDANGVASFGIFAPETRETVHEREVS